MALTGDIWRMDLRDSVKQPGRKELEYVDQVGRKYGVYNGFCEYQGGLTTSAVYYTPDTDWAGRKAVPSNSPSINDVLLVSEADSSIIAGSPAGKSDGMDHALLSRYIAGYSTAHVSETIHWDGTQEVYIRLYQKWGDSEDAWPFPLGQQKFIGHIRGTKDVTSANFWMQGQAGGTWGRLMFQPFINGSQSYARWETRSDNEVPNPSNFVFLANTWYEIEIRYKLASTVGGTDGEAEFWINGEQRYLETGLQNKNDNTLNKSVELQNFASDITSYQPCYMKNAEVATFRMGGLNQGEIAAPYIGPTWSIFEPDLITDQIISPNFIASNEAVYTPFLDPNVSIIDPPFISSVEQVFTPQVQSSAATISPLTINPVRVGGEWGLPQLQQLVFQPSVISSAQGIAPEKVFGLNTIYTPEVDNIILAGAGYPVIILNKKTEKQIVSKVKKQIKVLKETKPNEIQHASVETIQKIVKAQLRTEKVTNKQTTEQILSIQKEIRNLAARLITEEMEEIKIAAAAELRKKNNIKRKYLILESMK